MTEIDNGRRRRASNYFHSTFRVIVRKLRLPGWLQVLCKPLKTLTFVGGRRTRRLLRRKLIAKSHESGDKGAWEGVLSFNVKAPCYYVFPPLPPRPSYLRFQWNWSQYLTTSCSPLSRGASGIQVSREDDDDDGCASANDCHSSKCNDRRNFISFHICICGKEGETVPILC